MADLDDDSLVAAAQRGDRDALEALLRRHHDRIYALCRRMTGNDHDALDATQEALIAIVKGIHHFDGRAAFTTWSYRVATNACLDELRRRNRRFDPVDPQSDAVRSVGLPGFDEAVTTRHSIDEALEKLAPPFKTVVILRDQLGLEYSEIAEVLEIPVGTVRSRLARGRAALVDYLYPSGTSAKNLAEYKETGGHQTPPGTPSR